MRTLKEIVLLAILFQFGCKPQIVEPILTTPVEPGQMISAPIPAKPLLENDCLYPFAPNLDAIYGVWEPKLILTVANGDSMSFEPGKGHTGFILTDHYADAFELRPDSSLALYYVEYGRVCASREDGKWFLRNDSLIISRYPSDEVILPILSLTADALTVEDTVNFQFSRATYRRAN